MERTLFLSFVGLCFVASSHAATPKYRLIELHNQQTQGFLFGMGISSSNEVVYGSGAFVNGGASYESFSWKKGVKRNLVGLGGSGVGGYNRITTNGVYYGAGGYYDGSTVVRFPDRSEEGFYERQVFAFNDNLFGVGRISFEGATQTYLYEDGTVRIGSLGGSRSRGLDINKDNFALVADHGGSVGRLYYGKGTNWRDVSAAAPGLTGGYVWGAWLNDHGAIASRDRRYTPNASGGFDETIIPTSSTGLLPLARDINNHGWVLADSFTGGNHMLFDGTNTYELPEIIENVPAGSSFFTAEQINDNGWIVGTYKIGQDQHAFVLQPVPEPTSMLALGAGVAALMRRRRR